MKKKVMVLIVIALCLLILFSGCTYFEKQTKGIVQKGVRAEFVKGQPPEELIYDNQEFLVSFDLYNSMTFPMKVDFTLKDLLAETYGGVPDKGCTQSVTIPPAEEAGDKYIEGYLPIEYPCSKGQLYQYKNIPAGGVFENQFIVQLVADYNQIVLNPYICVKKGGAKLPIEINCPEQETITSENILGAGYSPIELTSIEKTAIPLTRDGSGEVRINLILNFENTGDGEVGEIGRDDERGQFFILNSVKIHSAGEEGDQDFQCYTSDNKKVNLRDKKAIVRCYKNINLEESDFNKYILDIAYSFKYKSSYATNVVKIVSSMPAQRGEEGETEEEPGEGIETWETWDTEEKGEEELPDIFNTENR